MISSTKTDKNMYCYRPNGSRYAVLSPYQWRRLRKQRQLDSYLHGQSFGIRPPYKLGITEIKPERAA